MLLWRRAMAYDQRSLDDYVDVAERISEFRDRYPDGTLQPVSLTQPWQLIQAEGFDKGGELIHQTFLVYVAAAYRTPDDPRPGIGAAWEVFPGRTPYTRGSELMNAETSAWGRAIIAVGAADAKRGVASRQEIAQARRRQGDVQFQHLDPATGTWLDVTEDQYREHIARAQRNAPPETREDGSATEAELTRMNRGHEPGTERFCGPAPDEGEWQDEPGQPLNPPSEEAWGSIGPQQKTRMFAMFTGLGMREKARQVAFIEEVTGVRVNSRNDLSYVQAGQVLEALETRSGK